MRFIPAHRLATRALVVLMILFSIAGCTAEVSESDTTVRNGLLYIKGVDEPFSGIVTGKTGYNEGYRRESCTFKKEYKDGVLDGRSFFYYPNGKVESVEPYTQGILNGVVTRYYDSGQLKARVHFVDGLRGGSKGEMFWNKDGSRQDG